ncbi:MAG: cation diffusion facilitator family transporter [Eubacteriales bacterium]|nr:cation diffusion facilitator family transporter [Eubacteriales bacterium]
MKKQASVAAGGRAVNENAIIKQISLVGIIGNVLLCAFKLYAGVAGKSGAMVSDAVHSLSDVFATFVAFLGVKLSKKSADQAHPYGHERLECIASLILGMILLVTGIGIGKVGLTNIFAGNYDQLAVPGTIALIAAVVSIVVKESMFWYTRHYAKVLNSAAFMADAWHHRSDAFSSIGSLIGIGGAILGFPVLDSIASVVICLCILKVAYDILVDAVKKMLDTSCGEEFENKLEQFILEQDGVEAVDTLHTRMFGNKVYVDLEIEVQRDKPLWAAHEVAAQVHNDVENSFENVKHIMIHVNPTR